MNFASGDARRQAALAQLAAAFSAHDFLSAERIARELLSADAGDEEALHLLAQILNRQERAAEAVELMGALCSFNPRCVAYHNDRGVMLAALGRWPEAVTAYENAVALDPCHVDAVKNAGSRRFIRRGRRFFLPS